MDRTPDRTSRPTVAQAAENLGVSAEAVRSRIKRGTLRSEKIGGTVYVLLGTDQPATGHRPDEDRTDDQTELVGELRDRVASLEAELERRSEELERRAREAERYQDLLAALTQANRNLSARLPELEVAPQRPPESPQSTGPASTPSQPSEGPQTGGEAPLRRLWRLFGR